ncbi:MAG TPA: hypothetical protein VJR92_06765 [Gemmatimonadaceae bacterium]|nr:hypothetical protein [Gemmatimonadaceae bacterium]
MNGVRLGFFVAAVIVGARVGDAQAPPARVAVAAITMGADNDDVSRGAFAEIGAARFGSDGSIYAIDPGECKVKQFSSTGRFVRSFGGSGGGPSEFSCRNLRLDVKDETVVVTDPTQARTVHFSREGRAAKTVPLPDFPGDYGVVRTVPLRYGFGVRIRTGAEAAPPRRDSLQRLVVRKLNEPRADTIANYRADDVAVEFVTGRRLGAPTGLGYGGAWTACGDSAVVVADGYAGAVTWYRITATGPRLARSATLGRTGALLTSDERRDAMTRVRTSRAVTSEQGVGRAGEIKSISALPTMWSVVWSVRCGDDGAVWVGMQDKLAPRTEWTVFPPTGSAYTVTLPENFSFRSARGDFVLGRTVTEDEVPVLRVYRLVAR